MMASGECDGVGAIGPKWQRHVVLVVLIVAVGVAFVAVVDFVLQ